MRATSRRFVAALVSGAALASAAHLVAQPATCLVTTSGGDVLGVRRGAICVYLGVPYAAPPVGTLRWRLPQPAAPWAPATLPANIAPPTCPLLNLATGLPQGAENCLTVNIWTPTVASGRRGVPVIVWLHPGGFSAASSNLAASDGQRFAEERNAIIVAPNYRLGPFGFLAHEALTVEDPNYRSSGNYGLADQRVALQWVQANIAAFGGDPDNVTLSGASAGATSVSLHYVAPASRGLFQRAIMQATYATSRAITIGEAHTQGELLAATLGCSDRQTVLTCLRSKSRDQVLTALPLGQLQFVEDQIRVQWGPVVDGVEVVEQPRALFRNGLFRRVPVIIGTNADEGWPFVDRSFPGGLDALQYESTIRREFGMDAQAVLSIYPASRFASPKDALARLVGDAEFVCEARRMARAMYREGSPVYLYSFDYTIPSINAGRAIHGAETNFVFGNNFAAPSAYVLGAPELALFATMSSYWRRFADTGDPTDSHDPVAWPMYRPDLDGQRRDPNSDQYLALDRSVYPAAYLRDSQCNFWESFHLRSLLGQVPAAAR